MATEKSCSFCEKSGLLILPVRYAIAPLDKKLPAVVAPLKVEDSAVSVGKGKSQDLKLAASAQYTTRLLRSGYVYVYDEKRDRMDAYWGTQDGYFMRILPGTAVPATAQEAKPCSDTGHPELAGCIAIADAERAGIVWLGFSDAQWTNDIIDAHRGAAGKHQRELHMRAFDARAWARAHKQSTIPGRGSTPHAVPMSELANTVAEFTPKPANTPLGFAPLNAPDYHLRAGQAEAVQTACARRSSKLQSIIIALDDPAGIAQDLATLIHWHQERLLDTRVAKDKYGEGYGYATTYRELAGLKSAMETLRAANDEKVKMEVFRDGQEAAAKLQAQFDDTPGIPFLIGKQIEREQAVLEVLRNPSPKTVRAAQTGSWNGYLGKIKSTLYSQWADEFQAAKDALDKAHIEPLARAHAAWMQSNQLANKLECTHDGKDALSGDIYAETLSRCMTATQNVPGCKALYVRWLQGDIGDRTNLLLRGLVLRQDDLIESVAQSPLEPRLVPWEKLMGQYAERVKALLKPSPQATMHAMETRAAAAKTKEKLDKAVSLARAVDGDYHMAGLRKDVHAKLNAAQAAHNSAQKQADAARLAAGDKLMPDSVATLLMQITGPIANALLQYNDKASTKPLPRWIAIVGTALRRPASVVSISGSAVNMIEFTTRILIDNMRAAATRSGKTLTKSQIRQLTSYAQRQVQGAYASGTSGNFKAALANETNSTFTVFMDSDALNQVHAAKGHNQKIDAMVASIKTPRDMHETGLLRIAARAPLYSAASEGALAAISVVFQRAAWKDLLEKEAKALGFQKSWQQDTRETLGGALYLAAIADALANGVKIAGTWRNLYAAGMAERLGGTTTASKLVERATKALRVIGVVTAGLSAVSAAMDIVDTYDSVTQMKWGLTALQLYSGGIGIAAAAFAGWAAAAKLGGATLFLGITLTMWGLVLAVVLVALGLLSRYVKGDNIHQWLERTYWGVLIRGRFNDAKAEQKGFEELMGVGA